MNPIDAFSDLEDPRSEKSRVYELKSLVFLTIAAVIAGADNFVDAAEFGKFKIDWLSRFVPFPDNRTPSHDALNDLFRALDPEKFEDCFINWTSQVCGITEGELISIDGKRLRGSYDTVDSKAAIHMVSAWASKNELVLAQRKVDEKENEITAIPQLLEVLEIKGAVVSIDAMGCQKKIAEQIVEAGADYILALKGNQSELSDEVTSRFKSAIPDSTHTDVNKDHGRIETRKCEVMNDLTFIDEADNWSKMHSIIRVTSTREELAKARVSKEERYYISSLDNPAESFNQLIRGHWGIENKLHWVLDVQFGEDHSRLRKDHVDQNFSIIRRIALNLIKLDKTPKTSQRVKRKKAGWNNRFLEKILRIEGFY